MLDIFSYASWPSVYLLWRNIYLGLLLFFRLGCFDAVKHHELFVNFGDSCKMVLLESLQMPIAASVKVMKEITKQLLFIGQSLITAKFSPNIRSTYE